MHELLTRSYFQTINLKRQEKTYQAILCINKIDFPLSQQTLQKVLHQNELALLAELKGDKRKRSFVAGRVTAKQALQKLGVKANYTEIGIEYGVFKYPVITYPGEQKIQVSYSHADDLCAALAFPESHPMAIDIENINFANDELLTSLISAEEEKLLQIPILMQVSREAKLTVLWSAKESLSKVLRTGLTLSFAIMEIEKIVPEHDYLRIEFKNFPQYKATVFFLENIACAIVLPKNTDIIMDIKEIQSFWH